MPDEASVEELREHAVHLQQALNAALRSEVIARRELDEYRVREIAALKETLSEMRQSIREELLETGGIEPEEMEGAHG